MDSLYQPPSRTPLERFFNPPATSFCICSQCLSRGWFLTSTRVPGPPEAAIRPIKALCETSGRGNYLWPCREPSLHGTPAGFSGTLAGIRKHVKNPRCVCAQQSAHPPHLWPGSRRSCCVPGLEDRMSKGYIHNRTVFCHQVRGSGEGTRRLHGSDSLPLLHSNRRREFQA